jgi:hypothetical protein
MAINQNHTFEELNGIKCAIVEKNVSPSRVEFLRSILEYNRYTVVVVASPPPKVAPAAAAVKPAAAVTVPSAPEGVPPVGDAVPPVGDAVPPVGDAVPPAGDPMRPAGDPVPSAAEGVSPAGDAVPGGEPPPPPAPETFTMGVTDVMFNPTNAIFGRLLKAPGGHVVTLAYWQQKDRVSNDEVPYFE